MSERLIPCPNCKELYDIEVVQIHNPDTWDMNANATLRCNKCQHQWEGKIMSPKHREYRDKGWCI